MRHNNQKSTRKLRASVTAAQHFGLAYPPAPREAQKLQDWPGLNTNRDLRRKDDDAPARD